MANVNEALDEKVVNRIRKLLNLGRDGGATEGEANNAMELAEKLMLANNLSMAQIEMSGGASSESRLKEQTKGKANYRWQRWLMTAIAEANFCHLSVETGKRKIRHGYRDIALGYQLIGRVSNVTAAQNMYEYLLQTCARMRNEYEGQPGNGNAEGALFVEGLAYRLAQRVQQRHEQMLEEQKAEAERQKKEQAARSSHPAYAGQGNALVVVMADYEQSERDANKDVALDQPIGTTAAKRAEREVRQAALDKKMNELIAAGVVWDVAWYMVNMNWDQAKAQAYYDKEQAEQAERDKNPKKDRGGKTREERLHERLYTGAAGDGRRQADKVSLNTQVGGNKGRQIS